ncbi:MAG: ferric reductase-like transmembrane domain-containing protein [Betaproteobacteria bacterium]|nr:ferric reductase-like transmembrane domain-containing protein [Betaproteobacteria bacterium]
MKNIKRALGALLLGLTGLWLLADTLLPTPLIYFTLRSVLVQYTGVIAFGAMSVTMMLATRPKWLEARLEGLDKMYRLHKWLGITGLGFGVVHWWLAQETKWMVGWGWLTRPARRGEGGGVGLGPAAEWLRGQRHLAESVGEWAFYAAALLIVLALVKRFPYHLFVKTHKVLAAAYLVLAYHSLVLTKADYWSQPMGWALALLLAGGCAAAVFALSGRIGAGRKVSGTITQLTWYPELRVLETEIRLTPGWAGHEAGQFAFVTSDQGEGAHPYTIASAWDPRSRTIVFITKALGDHTARLRDMLKVGATVRVEGPYGCFDFNDALPRQLWIGAGIGITPFVARMKQLARSGSAQPVDLFHPTADYSQAAIDKLTADARAAGVKLHILVSPRDGQLDGERIRAAVPGWREASIWFCGPPGFGQALRQDFVAQGLEAERFHQELFQMR